MIFLTTLVIFYVASGSQTTQQSIGGWAVTCENDSASSDGQYDRCHMKRSVDGVTVEVVRDAMGAKFTATIRGCKVKVPVDPVLIPQAELAGEDADKRFVGGQIRAIIENNKQCPKHGVVLSISGPEVPQLLEATSKLRSVAN